MQGQIVTGSYTGDTNAQNIQLGFTPDYVKVWNETDGDTYWEWFNGMTAGHALQATNHASTQFSKITSNGITAYAGTEAANSAGFTVGTALSESAKTFRYLAQANQ